MVAKYLAKKVKDVFVPPPPSPTVNEAQEEAIHSGYKKIVVNSCPGSGKTRTLTHRIHRLIEDGVDPNAILAITFTKAAAESMATKLKELTKVEGATICTFHSFGNRVLKEHGDKIGLKKFYIADEKTSMRMLCKVRHKTKQTYAKIRSFIGMAKARALEPKDINDSILSKFYADYNKRLRYANYLDFDDLLLYTIKVLQVKEVRDYYTQKYEHILIDEVQDTNMAQIKIIELLIGDNNLFLVGDQMQSIYGWRAAENKYMKEFSDKFDDAKHIILDINYRSTQEILDASYALIKHDPDCVLTKIVAARGKGRQPQIVFCKDSKKEIQLILNKIKQGGGSYSKYCVLYRLNKLAIPITQAFIKNNIPYKVKGFSNMSRATSPIITILGHTDGMYPKAKPFVKGFCSGLGKEFTALSKAVKKYKDVGDKIHYLRKALKYNDWIKETDEEWEDSIDELSTIEASAYEHDNVERFINSLSCSSTKGEGVTLSTIHSAKGLEWDTVFVIGVEDDILPHKMSLDDEEQFNEERRLLYVAMTRAKNDLYITACDKRTKPMAASRFLPYISKHCQVSIF